MRRIGNCWDEITSFKNLTRAARRAAKGKRHQRIVSRFLASLEYQALRLQRDLCVGSYQPGRLSRFTIYDPKRRTISVAPFRDRVGHHAIIDILEPAFDRRMIHSSFACRRGKGTHAALDYAQRLTRRYPWFLKFDVRKCFESLSHTVVLDTMSRLLKDHRVLDLIAQIVHTGGRPNAPDRGLPIGNLTSQWFANMVLNRLDHHIKEDLRIRGYCRYMDDGLIFGASKAELQAAHVAVWSYLADPLDLELKHQATIVAPTTEGVPFLGFSIYPAARRLRPQNKQRTYRRLKHRLWQHRQGQLDEERLTDCVRSIFAHLEHGTTLGLRRHWSAVFASRGPP